MKYENIEEVRRIAALIEKLEVTLRELTQEGRPHYVTLAYGDPDDRYTTIDIKGEHPWAAHAHAFYRSCVIDTEQRIKKLKNELTYL